MDFQQLLAKMQELDQPVPEAQETQEQPVEEAPVLDEEPVEECPADDATAALGTPVTTTPEPTMSVNLNAQGLDEIGELMKLIAKVNPDMPEPAIPSLPTTAPMPALPAVDLDVGDDTPELPSIDTDSDDSDDEKKDEWANEPNETEKDVDYMINKLAGGMNRPKGTHPKVAGGDNPMQRVKESEDVRAAIRAELAQRLAEIKGAQ